MNKATLKALKGSIAKWEKIVAGTGVDDGTDNCPLCKLFYGLGCMGCPVAIKSGRDTCKKTPYGGWMLATFGQEWPRRVIDAGQKKAARAELRFLKSLLPRSGR